MRGATSLLSNAGGAVSFSELLLRCSDGMQLAGQIWKPIAGHSLAAATSTSNTVSETAKLQPTKILCLHGWLDNCRSFARMADRVLPQLPFDAELVALDLPGHGLSSHKSIDGPTIVMGEYVYYVAEALQQLEWNSHPVILIGHSMGAAVSTMFAASFPERVQSLVLLEGMAPLSRNPDDISKHIREHVLRRQQQQQQQQQQESNAVNKRARRVYPTVTDAVKARCQSARNFPGNQWISTDGAEELVHRAIRPVQGGYEFVHDDRLYWPSVTFFTEEQSKTLLRDVQCPTALILAQQGWPIPQDKLQVSLEILKPIHFCTLPGSHHFHLDCETADAVASHVVDFLLHHILRSKH